VHSTKRIEELLEAWNVRWNSGSTITGWRGYCRGKLIFLDERAAIYVGNSEYHGPVVDEEEFVAWFYNIFLLDAIGRRGIGRVVC
jgi:hypothetical protein